MTTIKNKKILNIVLIFSVLALSAAYFIQYVMGHKPCNLCLVERIPYFGSTILISLIFITNKYERISSSIIAFLFIAGMITSFYHFGIEKGFFPESLVCELEKIMNNPTASDLLRDLENKTISCKEVNFRFFGVSLATLNTVISFILSVIMIKIVISYEKNR